MNPKQLIKDLIPPILIKIANRLKRRATGSGSTIPEWECMPEGWDAERDPRIKGWNVEEVLESYKSKWDAFLKTVEGATPFGISPEANADAATADVIYHNSIMIFGYSLARAVHGKDAISMLDWGGGIGHYYRIATALNPDVRIDYHCKDVPVLANHGRRLFPDAHFHVDDTCLARRYDFVMASASMHYSRDWRALMVGLTGATGGYLLVTGLPVVLRAPSFVFVQRPYRYGYDTEYLSWCLNRNEFLDHARDVGLRLDREFIVGHQPAIAGAPEQCQYRGYFFRL